MQIDYKRHFPFDEPREQQKQAIEAGVKAFLEDDKRFLIVDAGTGVGKSAIAVAINSVLLEQMKDSEDYKRGAYIITTQKILQEQYVKDFSKHPFNIRDLKSSSNYNCKNKRGVSCGEGQRMLRGAGADDKNLKKCNYDCVYRQAKSDFLAGGCGITNFSYFLAETMYSGKLEPRNLLIIDEAHNTEEQLSKFIEVTISEHFANVALKFDMPDVKTQFQAHKWVKDEYLPHAKLYLTALERKIEKLIGDKSRLEHFEKLANQLEKIDKHICKVERFLTVYDKDNWVFNLVHTDVKGSRKLEFKPIEVSRYSEDYLFRLGKKVILMSATILDKDAFCESLGIDPEQAEYVGAPSPFPVENRPIMFFPIGKMSAREIESSLPKLTEAVRSIMEQHKDEKGIIHTHTFRIANHLKRSLRSRRILIHDSSNRDEILKKHMNSKKPTVLISPSMAEGVDLKGDASRFQVICKIPYPYLGDKLVKKRMNRWKWWYPLQTAKKIIQAVGRSIRNEKDYAVTYILDEDWDRFYSRNKKYFPKTFRDSIK